MTMFWIVIAVTVLVVVGGSVLIGRNLSRPKDQPLSKHERMTALKASGALRHRKSNRD